MSKLRSTALLGAARLINLGVVLVSMRLFYEWIGADAVGAIVVLQGIATYCIALGDAGLGPGVQAQLVEAEVANDEQRTNRLVSSHRIFMLVAGLIVIAIHAILIFCIPLKGVPNDLRIAIFFLLSGIGVSGYLIGVAYTSFLAAKNRFGVVARANLASGLANSLSSIALVFLTRHPWGFALGSVIGQVVYVWILRQGAAKAGLDVHGFRYFRTEFAPCVSFMKKSVFTALGGVLAGMDRLIVNNIAGTAQAGYMGVAQRVPQTVTMAMPFMQVFQPEYARSYLQGHAEFQKTYLRNSTATLAIYLALIFIPTAFGESLLKVWLGNQFVPVLTPLLIAFGLEWAIQGNNVAFGLSANAAQKPGWVVPFVWLHGLGIVGLTALTLHQWGILGVAWLRVALLLIQVPALDWVMTHHISPGMSLNPLVPRKMALAVIGAAFWGAGYALSLQPALISVPLIGIALTPFWVYFYLATAGVLKLVEFPKSLLRFFPMIPKPIIPEASPVPDPPADGREDGQPFDQPPLLG